MCHNLPVGDCHGHGCSFGPTKGLRLRKDCKTGCHNFVRSALRKLKMAKPRVMIKFAIGRKSNTLPISIPNQRAKPIQATHPAKEIQASGWSPSRAVRSRFTAPNKNTANEADSAHNSAMGWLPYALNDPNPCPTPPRMIRPPNSRSNAFIRSSSWTVYSTDPMQGPALRIHGGVIKICYTDCE